MQIAGLRRQFTVTIKYNGHRTFGTATSSRDALCLIIKLVNKCGWKANHHQDRNLTPLYVVQNDLAVDQG
uniref:Uncharacterized protein n=1 Tax=Romanomermis culicivorax TaxID=13658 RepID=A0A915HTM5_ROMCU